MKISKRYILFNKQLLIPVIVSGIFIITCFMPVIQIILSMLDGGVISITNKLLFNDDYTKIDLTNWIVNSGLSFLFLFLFLKSETPLAKTIMSILSIFFLFCFIMFMTMDNVEDPEPYFLNFMIAGLISAIILCITALVKRNLNMRKYKA